ncbi:MAG: hypothetical protein GWP91_10310 [Rhodobacterales bacterium]|nr:hypothetical protein [Rhodobacterales bacterium]
MTRILGLLACTMMFACGGDDGGDSATGTTTDPNACDNEILEFYPTDGASDVYYRTTVDFTFDALDGSEAIKVTTGGAEVAGTSAVVDNRVVFTPTDALASSTTYDVELSWCDGPTLTSWTTSDIGDPADAASLAGLTFGLDIGGGRFVEPAGVGALIGGLLEQEVLMGVTAATDTEVGMMGALGDASGGQDMCTESFDFPVAAEFSENPYFIIESDFLPLDVSGVVVEIEDLEISGAFAADGSEIAGATLRGTLDVSTLDSMVGGDTCELLSTFGVPCLPCSGGGDTCLTVFVDSMDAAVKPGVTLEVVTSVEIAANPACGGATTP